MSRDLTGSDIRSRHVTDDAFTVGVGTVARLGARCATCESGDNPSDFRQKYLYKLLDNVAGKAHEI